MNKIKFPIIILALIIGSIITLCFCISVGTLKIPIVDTYKVILNYVFFTDYEVDSTLSGVVWKIRLPRVLLAFIIGAGLALCGVIMQAVVQNPLAEPYLLGISSGGYLGATIFIILGSSFVGILGSIGLPFFSFIGAIFATFSALFLATYKSSMTTTKLILSGTIINAACSAAANFIMALSGTDSSVARITFWMMGSLTSAKWDKLLLPALLVFVCSCFFITQFRNLNTMLQGDEAAITLGININFYRKTYLLIIALLTGVLVSTSGIIGFVGLIIPHISRSMIGADHRRLVPVAILTGGLFLMIVDALSRTVVENTELPIGIFTAIVGAPFFAYIMIKKNYNYSSR